MARQVPASMACVTDSNRPQPLWPPPPTACLTASGAASEVLCPLLHPCPHLPPASPQPGPPARVQPPGPAAQCVSSLNIVPQWAGPAWILEQSLPPAVTDLPAFVGAQFYFKEVCP